jgi:hypothetical protein
MSQDPGDSSLGIATGYGPDGSIPHRGRRYSVSHCVQSGSGHHPSSYLVGTGGLFPQGKAAGA